MEHFIDNKDIQIFAGENRIVNTIKVPDDVRNIHNNISDYIVQSHPELASKYIQASDYTASIAKDFGWGMPYEVMLDNRIGNKKNSFSVTAGLRINYLDDTKYVTMHPDRLNMDTLSVSKIMFHEGVGHGYFNTICYAVDLNTGTREVSNGFISGRDIVTDKFKIRNRETMQQILEPLADRNKKIVEELYWFYVRKERDKMTDNHMDALYHVAYMIGAENQEAVFRLLHNYYNPDYDIREREGVGLEEAVTEYISILAVCKGNITNDLWVKLNDYTSGYMIITQKIKDFVGYMSKNYPEPSVNQGAYKIKKIEKVLVQAKKANKSGVIAQYIQHKTGVGLTKEEILNVDFSRLYSGLVK